MMSPFKGMFGAINYHIQSFGKEFCTPFANRGKSNIKKQTKTKKNPKAYM